MEAPNVLIIDDNAALNHAMSVLFKVHGWQVESAYTLKEANQRLSSTSSPALIVLDLMLPDGGGETILRRVREEHRPSFVAVVSGTGDIDYLESVETMRPDALLSKPVHIDLILQAYHVAQSSRRLPPN